MAALKASVSNQPQNVFAPGFWNINGYVFDGFLELSHDSPLVITRHPVMLGAKPGDHCYDEQRRFTIRLVTSNCFTSKVPGQFPASPTRAISAYNLLRNLQKSHQFLTLVTNFVTMSHVLISNIHVNEDMRTKESLYATVTLEEVFVVDLQTTKASADPQVTDETERGQVRVQPTLGSFEKVKEDAIKLGKQLPSLGFIH